MEFILAANELPTDGENNASKENAMSCHRATKAGVQPSIGTQRQTDNRSSSGSHRHNHIKSGNYFTNIFNEKC